MEQVKEETATELTKEQILENALKTPFVFVPQRLDNESFEDYKIRRKAGNLASNHYKHGAPKTFWDSRTQGTFRKSAQ
jgi:hypothetical protein